MSSWNKRQEREWELQSHGTIWQAYLCQLEEESWNWVPAQNIAVPICLLHASDSGWLYTQCLPRCNVKTQAWITISYVITMTDPIMKAYCVLPTIVTSPKTSQVECACTTVVEGSRTPTSISFSKGAAVSVTVHAASHLQHGITLATSSVPSVNSLDFCCSERNRSVRKLHQRLALMTSLMPWTYASAHQRTHSSTLRAWGPLPQIQPYDTTLLFRWRSPLLELPFPVACRLRQYYERLLLPLLCIMTASHCEAG